MDRFGYRNKVLHANLTDRSTWGEEPGDDFFRRYAGGRGMIAHYLLKYVPRGAEPLGPDNVLVFAPGALTGAPVITPGAMTRILSGPSGSAPLGTYLRR